MGRRSALLAMMLMVAAAGGVAQDVAALLAAGDALYEARGDPERARQAAATFDEAATLGPGSCEARWKAARAFFYLGRIADDDKAKRRQFSEAIGRARAAVRLDPDSVEGHFWLGASYAEYGQARGVLKSLSLKDDIVREMNEVLRLDPRFGCGAAHITLGRIYFKVPAFLGGSLKKSRDHLEQARAVCPSQTTTLLYLAETYWKLEEKARAIETLEHLLRVEPYRAMLAEAERDKAEAARLLLQYKGRMTGHGNVREK